MDFVFFGQIQICDMLHLMFREDNEGFFTMVSCAIKMIHVTLSPGKICCTATTSNNNQVCPDDDNHNDNDDGNDQDYDDGNDPDDQVGRIKEIIIPAGGENVAPVNIEEEIKSELQEVKTFILIIINQNHRCLFCHCS